jgi:signal peptidase I
MWIPAKGATLDLTLDNLAVYRRAIEAYEGKSVAVKDGQILIDGVAADSYTFTLDYYWMMGDNRHQSQDSRYFGFVPEDHVVGRPSFVWLSLDNERGWFDGKVRWSRMFRGVK